MCSRVKQSHSRNQESSVYGASAKGNTLLPVFGLDHTLIRSAAERNPGKSGQCTVGTWIPIVSEAEARAHADDFLVLPWHFIQENQTRESDFLARGGQRIVPLPKPRVITASGRQLLS
jgi:NDP-4-keto-2,6-dideoxyhexose 3-C-methyltransferase